MRIVVVDPSRVIHRSVTEILVASGHEALCFTDAGEALARVAADETVACVLTSLETHPLDGFELCWQLRLLANAPRPLAILVMSSAHGSRSLGEVLDSGADDFMSKPPGRDELIARLRATERLLGLQRELIRQADTDHLSQLLNRGAFLRRAEHLAERLVDGTTPEAPMTALLIDIDHFKTINDRHGHAVGDAAIRAVAGVLRETGALSCRWGGEEFAVLVEGQGPGAAAVVAHNVRRRCAALRVPTPGEERVGLTVSIGVATWSGRDGMDGVMRRADVALYAAKAGGRDRVSMMANDAFIECIG
ncbi:MAG: diguanylate cyclase [Methylobacterium sp.]|uniref:GGDEF domain-containing response regulator n=2 Tax=unclassified Methylobacterium TaxID=2615210 RepID=UPI0027216E32|nr:diguanylate cyclase [Methylobacterium sp.]MDO9426641.1 diguanylate cyclase [Methylobacterium sp.]